MPDTLKFLLLEAASRTRFLLVGLQMRLKFAGMRSSGAAFTTFTCNICGHRIEAPLAVVKERETRSCYHCGSTLRYRSIIAALSLKLYGKVIPLAQFPADQNIRGIGMSDPNIYALRLRKKIGYSNSFYHKAPFLDILAPRPDQLGQFRFVISSEVLEHIPPPAGIAFNNLHRLLADDGFAIFSVPYLNEGTTTEHFPNLHQFKLVDEGGKKVLLNTTKDGKQERFTELCFHGGWGQTLEMRVFSLPSLQEHCREAGFSRVEMLDQSLPESGIYNDHGHSFVFMLQK